MGGHISCVSNSGIFDIIREDVAVLLHSVLLLPNRDLVLPCVASLDALVPCVLKQRVGVGSSPAGSEPRATMSATTGYAEFLDVTACETRGADVRRSSSS